VEETVKNGEQLTVVESFNANINPGARLAERVKTLTGKSRVSRHRGLGSCFSPEQSHRKVQDQSDPKVLDTSLRNRPDSPELGSGEGDIREPLENGHIEHEPERTEECGIALQAGEVQLL
jgi:hypothetical protein